ncbi:MAG: porin [Hydrogenophaga sp.]
MKKTLIALAVLAASSAAMAQSSVTLYGIADAGIFKDKGQSADMRSGGLNSSRLGFKGTEDLGGGLSAIFQLEQGIDLTSGAASGFGRQAYVGLAGGFGTVKLGNVYTAYDDIAAGAALGFDSGKFDSQDIFGSMAYNSNPGSNLYYATPEFGGFSGAVSYSVNVAKQDYTSMHVKYNGGPLYVGLGYQDQSDAGTGKLTTLNGTYDFGIAKLLLAYGTTSGLGANNTDDVSIGAEVPVGPALVVSVGYARSEPDVGASRSGFALMGNYSLSKRTIVYAGYRNDNAAAVAAGVGADSRFGVGIRHAF